MSINYVAGVFYQVFMMLLWSNFGRKRMMGIVFSLACSFALVDGFRTNAWDLCMKVLIVAVAALLSKDAGVVHNALLFINILWAVILDFDNNPLNALLGVFVLFCSGFYKFSNRSSDRDFLILYSVWNIIFVNYFEPLCDYPFLLAAQHASILLSYYAPILDKKNSWGLVRCFTILNVANAYFITKF